MMRYKGYTGVMEVDPEAELIHGRVVGLRDVITFQGNTVAESRQAFQDSIDDYLEWCATEGRRPDKPFSGKLLIRVDPASHRSLAQLAEARATSINNLAAEALANLIDASQPDASQAANVRLPASSKSAAPQRRSSPAPASPNAVVKKPARPPRPVKNES